MTTTASWHEISKGGPPWVGDFWIALPRGEVASGYWDGDSWGDHEPTHWAHIHTPDHPDDL